MTRNIMTNTKMTKIGFAGAQGTGKTTLVLEMLKEMPDFKQYNNIHRLLAQNLDDFNLNQDANNISQIVATACTTVQMMTQDKIIADRTLIDTFAYTDLAKKVTNKWEIENTFAPALKFYDIIFYCPIEFEMEEDGVRDGDQWFRNQIDQRIKHHLDHYNMNYVTLTGTIEERMNQIREALTK